MEHQISVLKKVCSDHNFRGCSRLNEILSGEHRLPPDLFLTALIGVVEDLIAEARDKGMDGLASILEEVRRDLEWSLREAVE